MKYFMCRRYVLMITASCFLALSITHRAAAQPEMQKLAIADNHRFLVKADGRPFVWIGDTNWFFAKLPPQTIDRILDDRVDRGFTIMLVSCRETSYAGVDPGPIDQPNETWWNYLDEYIDKCEQRGLYVGITLGWWGLTRKFDAAALYRYGKWVGHRYRNRSNIVWLTLGEAGGHRRKTTIPQEKIAALVRGIREGDTGNKLLTIHADYQRGTSISEDAALCDFNNWQTSQWCCPEELPRSDQRQWTVWEAMAFDYQQQYDGRPKPTIDSEPWYENNKDFCGATDFEIRRRAYFTVFAGAFGHTYGAGGIWDGLAVSDTCSQAAAEAIDYPGVVSIAHLSNFLHRLGDDFLRLRPAQVLITSGNAVNYDEHIQAAVDINGKFALIYSADDAPYTIDLSLLRGKKLRATWYNPRTDQYRPIAGEIGSDKVTTAGINPPGTSGPGNDWILLIGNASFYKRTVEPYLK